MGLATAVLTTLSVAFQPFAPALSARLGRSASKRSTDGRVAVTTDDENERRYLALVRSWEARRQEDRASLSRKIAPAREEPSFSLVLTTFPDRADNVQLASFLSQSHARLEVLVASDAPDQSQPEAGDARVVVVDVSPDASVAQRAAACLARAKGDYVLFPGARDRLDPDALLAFAAEAIRTPRPLVIYADEDRIDDAGRRFAPHFKPDWNRELFYSCNFISAPVAVDRVHIEACGGMRDAADPFYDLLLRCTGDAGRGAVRHIPRVLCHRLAPRSAASVERTTRPRTAATLARHLEERHGIPITVEDGDLPGSQVVRWPLPSAPPRVSIIIPTRDRLPLVRAAVLSVIRKTKYPDYEILIVDNESTDPDTLDWLDRITREDDRVKVLRIEGPFNFSALNNRAAAQATGEVLCLLNNDVEVISPEWLYEMTSLAIRPGTGCVGARLLYPDGTVQHAGVLVGMRSVAGHAFRGFSGAADGYEGRLRMRQEVTAVTAACLVVRRDIYTEVGGLDEHDLAIAYNDLDFCLKVRARGHANVWTPFAELLHRESTSRGSDRHGDSRRRLQAEADVVVRRWSLDRFDDPAYNPNLTHETEDFAIAAPHEVRARGG